VHGYARRGVRVGCAEAWRGDGAILASPMGLIPALGAKLAQLTFSPACARTSRSLPAKFWAADAGHRITHTAVHVHGGGIDMDYPLHRYLPAAQQCELTLGGATAQVRRIGAALASEG